MSYWVGMVTERDDILRWPGGDSYHDAHCVFLRTRIRLDASWIGRVGTIWINTPELCASMINITVDNSR